MPWGWWCNNCKQEVQVAYKQVASVVQWRDDVDIEDWGEYVEDERCLECGSKNVEYKYIKDEE